MYEVGKLLLRLKKKKVENCKKVERKQKESWKKLKENKKKVKAGWKKVGRKLEEICKKAAWKFWKIVRNWLKKLSDGIRKFERKL